MAANPSVKSSTWLEVQLKYPGYHDFGMQALAALTDFAVADQQTPIQTAPPVEWAEVQRFCQAEVQRIGYRWFEDEDD